MIEVMFAFAVGIGVGVTTTWQLKRDQWVEEYWNGYRAGIQAEALRLLYMGRKN